MSEREKPPTLDAFIASQAEQGVHVTDFGRYAFELDNENKAIRRALSMMHRRAQANEGAAHRLQKVRDGFDRELCRQAVLFDDRESKWKAFADSLRRDVADMRIELADARRTWFARFFDWLLG